MQPQNAQGNAEFPRGTPTGQAWELYRSILTQTREAVGYTKPDNHTRRLKTMGHSMPLSARRAAELWNAISQSIYYTAHVHSPHCYTQTCGAHSI